MITYADAVSNKTKNIKNTQNMYINMWYIACTCQVMQIRVLQLFIPQHRFTLYSSQVFRVFRCLQALQVDSSVQKDELPGLRDA